MEPVLEPVKAEAVDAAPFDGEERTVDGWALVCLKGDTVPRILDTDLAERLEYSDPVQIRKLIDRHRETLEKLASVRVTATVAGTSGGRPGRANYLTDEQAAYIAAKSDMPKATAITIAMVKVFVAWGCSCGEGSMARRGQPCAPTARPWRGAAP